MPNVQSEVERLGQQTSGLGDLNALAGAVEAAQQALAQSESAAQNSEASHVAARQQLEAARAPLTEADKRGQRLETGARTVGHVAKGFEKALGAARGDDLDAPVDPSAPMRWTNAGVIDGDPALPDGVESLAAHVDAPSELARRLAQIGVVAKERGAELVSQWTTGQRLAWPERGDGWGR